MRQIILASQSRQRSQLLATLDIQFKTVPADIDELAIDNADHQLRASLVAKAKAKKIHTQFPSAIIIAADTFVVHEEYRLEKPLTKTEAKQMLQRLSGQAMQVHTGWVYLDKKIDLEVVKTTTTDIKFRQLSADFITKYVDNNPVSLWAGAFSLIHLEGISLVASIHGSLTNVLGLPIEELVPLLEQSNEL